MLESKEEFQRLEQLQAEVAGDDGAATVPAELLAAWARDGGVVLGLFDSAAPQAMVGFVFGYLGTVEADPGRPALARLKHCSHRIGVLPAYRGQGVRYALKVAQRAAVRRQGIRLITWRVDPLQAADARLYISKLGAVSRTVLRNIDDPRGGRREEGLQADRLQVEWWITSNRVEQRLTSDRPQLSLASFTSADVPILNQATFDPGGLPRPKDRPLEPRAPLSLVEFPADFDHLQAVEPQLALAWRAQLRQMLEAAFQSGFFITDVTDEVTDDGRRLYYLLAHGEARLGRER